MSEFHKSNDGPPRALRELYLDSLPEPQELFLEKGDTGET